MRIKKEIVIYIRIAHFKVIEWYCKYGGND